MTIEGVRLLTGGLTFPESARWHADRLWFAQWGSGEILAVGADGTAEAMDAGPNGYGWSIEWLPDGSLLTTGPELIRTTADGTRAPHGDLGRIAEHGWNEIVVTVGGDVYVNGLVFDVAGGGAPQPGVIALVQPDGTTRQVAADLQFPNGMVITDNTLIVSESFAGRLTAFDIEDDGGLVNRRVWAEGVAPDGICLDDGAVWCGAQTFK